MPKKENSTTSVGLWMLIILVQAMPCIGFIMSIVWAFSGTNETRKNYFKAHLGWLCIAFALWLALLSAGLLPGIIKSIKSNTQGIGFRTDPHPDEDGIHFRKHAERVDQAIRHAAA